MVFEMKREKETKWYSIGGKSPEKCGGCADDGAGGGSIDDEEIDLVMRMPSRCGRFYFYRCYEKENTGGIEAEQRTWFL